MNAKAEVEAGRLDGVKLTVALALIAVATGGFYYYSEQSLLLRVVGLLVVVGISTAIALQTERGRALWRFAKEARTEMRKVVWPTRAETTQTTVIVMIMVVVMALLLWAFDAVLMWAIEWLTEQGA